MTSPTSQSVTAAQPAERRETRASLRHWLQLADSLLGDSPEPMLPAAAIPNAEQRRQIEETLSSLEKDLTAGPWERTAKAIAVVLAAYPISGGDEMARARVQAFRVALDDVPAWAVEEAARDWLRGQVPSDYNTTFAPLPPQLRKLAERKWVPLIPKKRKLLALLKAKPAPDDHLSEADRAYRIGKFKELIAGIELQSIPTA